MRTTRIECRRQNTIIIRIAANGNRGSDLNKFRLPLDEKSQQAGVAWRKPEFRAELF